MEGENNAKGFKVLRKMLAAGPTLFDGCSCTDGGLRTGLMTPQEAVPKKHQEWVRVLQG